VADQIGVRDSQARPGGGVQATDVDPDRPLLPDYGGACVCNVAPTLLEPPEVWPEWFPARVAEADQVLLVVLDGLGWEQLRARSALAPMLSGMDGGPILTVAPSTTSTAMTSITTGLTPGAHGVVGYRVAVDGAVLNVLRWSVSGRDARSRIPPEKLQPVAAFEGQRPPAVTRADFRTSGFTAAHLDGVRFHGYRVSSSLVVEAGRLLRAGEPFVYAYYEGIDKVAHEYGLAEHFDAELAYVDRLVSDLAAALPPGAAMVVTCDHGQVVVGDQIVALDRDVFDQLSFQSGEGRFRWLHARAGRSQALLEAAETHHGHQAWVIGRDQLIDDGWLGPEVTDAARGRLGDVALVARGTIAFFDRDDGGPFELISRHGSLTPAEMRVPLLAHYA
jgi:predicted AlkP superfamily pyrophosphatase or phosphodiesterase